MKKSTVLLFAIFFFSSCGKDGELTYIEGEPKCWFADGRQADCKTGFPLSQNTPAPSPNNPEPNLKCGEKFKTDFEVMLEHESSLDNWILHCELTCGATVRAQIRNAAENLLRSAQIFQKNFPDIQCKGRFQGGNKIVDGEISSKLESERAIEKARRHQTQGDQ